MCRMDGTNTPLRADLLRIDEDITLAFVAPPRALCTDTAAMIAWVGYERYVAGDFDDSSLTARPRWPLDEVSPAMLGFGKKGAKA